MKPEGITEATEQCANAFFGRGVPATDAAHVPGATRFGEPVFVSCDGSQGRSPHRIGCRHCLPARFR
jgi:hypothetical protein